MKKIEQLKRKAQDLVKSQSLETLISGFELTSEQMEKAKGNDELYLSIAQSREWIMNELKTRNPAAFDLWIDGNEESPRSFFIQ